MIKLFNKKLCKKLICYYFKLETENYFSVNNQFFIIEKHGIF